MPTVEFTIPHAPPSMNAGYVRSHWKGFHNEKRAWQERFVKALNELNLPRPFPTAHGPLRVDVLLTFQVPRNRDEENYRPVLSKALGDALTTRSTIIDGARYEGGWLLNDTGRDWKLSLTISHDTGPDSTHVLVTWGE